MTTAWQALQAASSLRSGTAWQLLTHPMAGAGGGVMNEGLDVEVGTLVLEAALADLPLQVDLQD